MKQYFLCAGKHHKQEIVFDEESNIIMGGDEKQWLGRAGGFDTIEKLREVCKVLNEPCIECGGLIPTTYHEPIKSELISRNVCLSCNIWINKLATLPDPNCFIVNGGVYNTRPEFEGPGFRGFGGSEFKFMKDSVLTVSKNVWFNGYVPDHFKDRIKDNATREK